MDIEYGNFVWDEKKEAENVLKHDVDFALAIRAFLDAQRKIFTDEKHSQVEVRKFCIGKVDGKILTVRYVERQGKIRIIGAGYWRGGRKYYYDKKA